MRNLCLFLCRNRTKYLSDLYQKLKKNIDVYFVCDNEIDSKQVLRNNFTDLNRLTSDVLDLNKYKITAWEKSFFYIHKNNLINKYNNIYFIEDDVYSKNFDTYSHLIKYWNTLDHDFISSAIKSKQQDAGWSWWSQDTEYERYFQNPYRAFNPLCRLSSRLIEYILEFRKQNNKFYFQEILFSSIVVENKLNYIDYNFDKDSNKYIGKIHFRPKILPALITDNKLYHPVKPYL
jgi:hypothetical protein